VIVDVEHQYSILDRNVDKSPVGTQVEIVQCNEGLKTELGYLKGFEPIRMVRSISGWCMAFSRDIDDLILLIADRGWVINDKEIMSTVNALRSD